MRDFYQSSTFDSDRWTSGCCFPQNGLEEVQCRCCEKGRISRITCAQDWLNWGSRSLEIRGQRRDEDLPNCTSTFSHVDGPPPPHDDVSELCGVSKAPQIRSSLTGHQAHTPSWLRSATESHKAELPRDQHEMSTCETCNPTRGLTPKAKRKSTCSNMFQFLSLINTDQNTPTELTFGKTLQPRSFSLYFI